VPVGSPMDGARVGSGNGAVLFRLRTVAFQSASLASASRTAAAGQFPLPIVAAEPFSIDSE
jgi:hypothetical protein